MCAETSVENHGPVGAIYNEHGRVVTSSPSKRFPFLSSHAIYPSPRRCERARRQPGAAAGRYQLVHDDIFSRRQSLPRRADRMRADVLAGGQQRQRRGTPDLCQNDVRATTLAAPWTHQTLIALSAARRRHAACAQTRTSLARCAPASQRTAPRSRVTVVRRRSSLLSRQTALTPRPAAITAMSSFKSTLTSGGSVDTPSAGPADGASESIGSADSPSTGAGGSSSGRPGAGTGSGVAPIGKFGGGGGANGASIATVRKFAYAALLVVSLVLV